MSRDPQVWPQLRRFVPIRQAFYSGNLRTLTKISPAVSTGALTRIMRSAEFIIAADNDRETPGNPGPKAALEAAIRFGLRMEWPEFPAGVQGSDWNDLAAVLDYGEEGSQ